MIRTLVLCDADNLRGTPAVGDPSTLSPADVWCHTPNSGSCTTQEGTLCVSPHPFLYLRESLLLARIKVRRTKLLGDAIVFFMRLRFPCSVSLHSRLGFYSATRPFPFFPLPSLLRWGNYGTPSSLQRIFLIIYPCTNDDTRACHNGCFRGSAMSLG